MSFRPPSFRSIIAFEAAARHENFARAAAELNLTQSAISHAIRVLEERLEDPLFLRVGRRVLLTPNGAQLAQRVRASLTLLTEAFETPAEGAGRPRVVIGAPREFATRVLLPRLCGVALMGPCEVRADVPVSALADGSVDILIAPGGGRWPSFSNRPLDVGPLVAVCAPGLAASPDATPLTDLPLVENTGHPWRLWFQETRLAAPPRPPALVVQSWDLAIEAAVVGAGVCLAPQALVREDLRTGRLVRAGTDAIDLPAAYHLVWDPGHGQKPGVHTALGWLTDALSNGVEAATTPRRAATGRDRRLSAV